MARKWRRGSTHVVKERVVKPLVPISLYANKPEENGTLVHFMFPCGGIAGPFIIHIDKAGSEVILQVYVRTAEGRREIDLPVREGRNVIKQTFAISGGDRLELICPPNDSIEGVWIAFLFEPPIIKRPDETEEIGNAG